MFKRSILRKIFGLLLLMSIIAASVILIVTLTERAHSVEQSLVQENKLLAQTAAKTIETGYLTERWPFQTLKLIADSENIVFLWIVEPDNTIYFADEDKMFGQVIESSASDNSQVTVTSSTYGPDNESIKLVIHPLQMEARSQPWSLYLGVSLSTVEQAKRRIILQGLLMLLGMIFLAGLISFYLAKGVIRPLEQLGIGARAIGKGKLDYRIKVQSHDELGDLGRTFNKMAQALGEIDKIKSEFISIASHQLRTPLSIIKWTLKMFLNGDLGKLSKDQKNFLDKTYQSNERMIGLVNDLLDVSRIEEGNLEYQMVKFDLTALLSDVINQFKVLIKNKEIKFKTNIKQTPKILINGDPKKLFLLFNNLIDNAVKFTIKGGAISVTLSKDKKAVQIVIKDNGIGIGKSDQNKLFSRFFRAEQAIKMQTEGTGLGLFIAKNIIKKHKGQIKLVSQAGKGTSVTCKLPL